MTRRWISLGVGIAGVLLLTAGAGLAAGREAGVGGGQSGPAVMAACDGMHRSPEMRELHASMPGDGRARCERMHAGVDRVPSGMGPMIGGSTMMASGGGSAMTGSSGGGRMCDHRTSGPAAG
jgi:hypothetical protein